MLCGRMLSNTKLASQKATVALVYGDSFFQHLLPYVVSLNDENAFD